MNNAYRLVWLSALLVFFLFISSSQASEKKPLFTNVSGGQFTVTWITDNTCSGIVYLYKNSNLLGEFYDDRGRDFKSTTHHITISDLDENTTYALTIESDGLLDNNKGLFYTITTGPHIIPVGSIQPAGKVSLADGLTPATGSMVYVSISRPEGGSAMLSTLVDKEGYWYIELINAREADYQKLYPVSEEKCRLTISVIGEKGTANLEAPLMDNQGGKRLYETLILK